MNKKLLIALLLITPLLLAPLTAGVYKYTDENGNVVFTDAPPATQETEEIDLPEIQSTTEFNAPRAIPRRSARKNGSSSENFTVSMTPANGEAIRANGGVVAVSASIDPTPKFALSAKFYLDGALVATSSSMSSSISNVERGEHTFMVEVMNSKSGVVVGTASSQVNVLRASILRR